MKLQAKMEYAIRLADPESRREFEDLFKLASLLDEIEKLQQSGVTVNADLKTQFRKAMKVAYETNGAFRQEVERFADAKRLIRAF